MIKVWQCHFWVTDGYCVYKMLINAEDQIISKTYMTRVESENTRLRPYLARLHRKTLCYSPYADRKSALIPQPLLPGLEKGSKSHF